jgi:hypothetical protein
MLAFLRLARRSRADNGLSTDSIDQLIEQYQQELENLSVRAGGRIISRRRPLVATSETCTIFIDECGSHSLKAKESFDAFCLAAVIIRDSEFSEFDQNWKKWKAVYLKTEKSIVHEPDVRRGNGSFYCGGDPKKRAAAIESLPSIIEVLPFRGIVCIVNRPKYLAAFGDVPLDASLPQHPYLMTLHFIAERAALALQEHYGGAKARLVFESRGPKEDAMMQYEFARLFLDGTSYVSAKFFRAQFLPGLTFLSKSDNSSGLQLADLMARPCAEKVLKPDSNPERWPAFRKKLCEGKHTAHSILGLKVLPWDERLENV